MRCSVPCRWGSPSAALRSGCAVLAGCVCVCARACVRVRVRECMCVSVSLSVCVWVCVLVLERSVRDEPFRTAEEGTSQVADAAATNAEAGAPTSTDFAPETTPAATPEAISEATQEATRRGSGDRAKPSDNSTRARRPLAPVMRFDPVQDGLSDFKRRRVSTNQTTPTKVCA